MMYFDYSAHTPADPRVLARFCEVAREYPGNANSPHGEGLRANFNLVRGRLARTVHLHNLVKEPSIPYQQLVNLLTRANWEGWALLENTEKEPDLVAALICWEFRDTVYIHHTVYNPAFAQLSPGTMFMGLVLGQYMQSGRFRFADLLCGFADFYKPWATRIVTTSHIQVYRLSVKTRLFLLLHG
jgi:CelD/BcsL family acetyltransferase involved in cellulose biosynthesis